jgi:mono/diheme cytochrome c family protein
MNVMSRATLAAAAVLVAVIAGHARPLMAARPTVAAGTARQELPEGPGKAELMKRCDGCHDLTFTVATRETEEGWTRIVNDMRSKGTDGSEEEFAKIIAYLTKHMGKPTPSGGHADLALPATARR